MPMKNRDYKREYQLQKRRGESGTGSDSGNAKRHRARRKYESENGKLPSNKELDHKKPLKDGGSNSESNTRVRDKSANRSHGGKIGNSKAKGRRKR